MFLFTNHGIISRLVDVIIVSCSWKRNTLLRFHGAGNFGNTDFKPIFSVKKSNKLLGNLLL